MAEHEYEIVICSDCQRQLEVDAWGGYACPGVWRKVPGVSGPRKDPEHDPNWEPVWVPVVVSESFYEQFDHPRLVPPAST